tara:strand:- start:5347 stop:5793 length:447 start_codon:yes stop_codon:yes gene_type:complete
MANIFDVAKYILDTTGGYMSTMKLQKLCYYSQAWNLVWENEPLFEEEFQAWVNGPVNMDLFQVHKGEMSISYKEIPDGLKQNLLTEKQILNIQQVLNFYGDKTGAWLSELSHKESPWLDARGDLPPSKISSKVISKSSIRNYYLSLTN